ncbi:hypothetical protein [Stackebrandtia soli]|uniref:hypothetical protein n=1 Tax=Stackebrandtia soli TaxID=1892856 RepID=UPI0039E7C19F
MNCASARAALSARMDDEDVLDAAATLDHLRECAACGEWIGHANRISETARKRYVSTPDLTEPVLRRIGDHERGRAARLRAWRRGLRWAVGVAAIAQLGLALPALWPGADVGGHALHASREMASFDIAVAVGFLLAAIRPDRARAFVPVAFALAGCLAVTSLVDIAGGATDVLHEASHATALVQAGLLWALGRTSAGRASQRERVAVTT